MILTLVKSTDAQKQYYFKKTTSKKHWFSKQMWCFKPMLILYKTDVSSQIWYFKTVFMLQSNQTKPCLVLFTENWEMSECYTLCITVTFTAYLKCDVPSVPISLINHKLFCTQKCQEYYAHLLDICYSLTLKPHIPPGPVFVKANTATLTLIN